MRATRCSITIGVGLIAAVLTLPSGSEGAPRGCSGLPKPRMRVRVTTTSEVVPGASRTIQDVVTRVWSREGIVIDWVTAAPGLKLEDVDAWILARHDQRVAGNPDALGAVVFSNGVPRPLVRLSIDAVIRWLQRAQAARLGLGPALGRFMRLSFNETDRRVERMLGYAAAHELGHLWLASRSHTGAGLMRSAYDSLVKLDEDPGETSLDARSRLSLAARLASAALCR